MNLMSYQDLFDNDGIGVPWYVYAGGFALILFIGQTIGKIATTAIQEMENVDAKWFRKLGIVCTTFMPSSIVWAGSFI